MTCAAHRKPSLAKGEQRPQFFVAQVKPAPGQDAEIDAEQHMAEDRAAGA
jgi:hypothetical protein